MGFFVGRLWVIGSVSCCMGLSNGLLVFPFCFVNRTGSWIRVSSTRATGNYCGCCRGRWLPAHVKAIGVLLLVYFESFIDKLLAYAKATLGLSSDIGSLCDFVNL